MITKKILKIKKKEGFTLIELIVSMGIIAVMLTVTTSVITNLLRESQRTDISADLERNVSYSTEIIKRSIRDVQDSSKIVAFPTDSSQPSSIAMIKSNGDFVCIDVSSSNIIEEYDIKEYDIIHNLTYNFSRIFTSILNSSYPNCISVIALISTPPPSTSPINLTTSTVTVKQLYFIQTSKFLQITAYFYDSNKIIYTDLKPFIISTGVVLRAAT